MVMRIGQGAIEKAPHIHARSVEGGSRTMPLLTPQQMHSFVSGHPRLSGAAIIVYERTSNPLGVSVLLKGFAEVHAVGYFSLADILKTLKRTKVDLQEIEDCALNYDQQREQASQWAYSSKDGGGIFVDSFKGKPYPPEK